jgi:glycosyltransferase involved in cell wall biosynthesis
VKILALAPHPYHIDRGSPIDLDILLRALSNRGETVDAVVYHEGKDQEIPGVTLHRIRPPRWVRNIGPGFSPKKLVADVYLFALAWRLVRRNRYDVVHAGEEAAFIALFFKWLYRLPYVYDMDSSIAQQLVEKLTFLRPLAGLFDRCEAVAIRNAIAAAPVCNALADLARKRGARHVETLHDISQLKNPNRRPTGELRERLSAAGPILMYVGNFEPYQGIDLLLDAFAVARRRGSAAELVLAGGADADIANYAARAQTLGLDGAAHFLGRWPAERLDELLAEADVLVAPRITGINTPQKIFPYLHSGRPVLVTDLPTHSQILTPEVACLAPAEPEGFADAIIALVRDEPLRRRLGEAGRAFVEANHTFDAHQRRVDRLYDHIRDAVASQVTRRRSARGRDDGFDRDKGDALPF